MNTATKFRLIHFPHQVGGNAVNNVVGASRLNLKTAIYINIGSDGFGKQIKERIKQEGADTRYVVANEGMESNFSTVISFKGERTIFVYHQNWKYDLPDLDSSKWVYLTSLSPSFADSNIINQVIQYIERTRAKLVFNPGTFQIKHGIKKYPRLLAATELFIVNMEEAKIILGYKEDEKVDVKKLLNKIADLGPRLVVITDGREGSYGFDGEKYFSLDSFPGKLVETTGAGDAFATGTLAGLYHGKDLNEAMRWGAVNGASVVEQIGPQAGLLTYPKMQEKLKEYARIVAKEI